MIEVTIGTNLSRQKVTVSPDTTLRRVLEDNGVDYSRGNLHMDGASVRPGDLDKTFAQHGITEKCLLLSVVKADSSIAA